MERSREVIRADIRRSLATLKDRTARLEVELRQTASHIGSDVTERIEEFKTGIDPRTIVRRYPLRASGAALLLGVVAGVRKGSTRMGLVGDHSKPIATGKLSLRGVVDAAATRLSRRALAKAGFDPSAMLQKFWHAAANPLQSAVRSSGNARTNGAHLGADWTASKLSGLGPLTLQFAATVAAGLIRQGLLELASRLHETENAFGGTSAKQHSNEESIIVERDEGAPKGQMH